MTVAQQEPDQSGVALWLMHLPAAEAVTWPTHPYLSALESARAQSLPDPAARGFYTASVVFRRTVLGALLNLPPAEVCFEPVPRGHKPCLARHQNPADWQFNLSHSGEYAVLAVVQGRAVGIDLERMRGAVNWRGVAQTAFSPSEQKALLAAAPVQKLEVFYHLWTAKEAYFKACGVGLGAPLEAVAVAVGNVAGAEIRVVQPIPGDVKQWWGQSVILPAALQAQYRAAVIVQAAPTGRFSISVQRWTPADC